MSAPIEMRYELSQEMMQEGIVWVSRAVLRARRSFLSLLIIGGAVFGLGAAGLALARALHPGAPVMAMLTAFIMGIALHLGLLQVLFGRQVKGIAAEQMRIDGGPSAMGFDDTGFTLKTGLLAARLFWEAVHEVALLKDRLIVMRVGATAYILPVSAVPEGMTAQDLLDRINAWRGV